MRYAVVLALLLAPATVFSAGFAKQSLFLSKPSVTEGETVLIHAVVNNDSAASFKGEMTFNQGSAAIGKVPVSLDAGEAQAVSVSWKPAAGSHSITAELKADNEVVERQSATFSVAEKPKPAAQTTSSSQAAAVESSDGIQQGIAGFSPQAADATAPVFKLIDGGRAAAAEVLEGQIANTKKNLGPAAGEPGGVLGAEAVKNASSNPMGTFWFILQTLYLYLLTVLNFIIGGAGVFYPVFALLILYMLWRLIRRFRRPAY